MPLTPCVPWEAWEGPGGHIGAGNYLLITQCNTASHFSFCWADVPLWDCVAAWSNGIFPSSSWFRQIKDSEELLFYHGSWYCVLCHHVRVRHRVETKSNSNIKVGATLWRIYNSIPSLLQIIQPSHENIPRNNPTQRRTSGGNAFMLLIPPQPNGATQVYFIDISNIQNIQNFQLSIIFEDRNIIKKARESFVLNYAALEHDSIILGKTRECWTQRISKKESMEIFFWYF